MLTGLSKGFQIIGEGKSLVPAGSNAVFGPRLLIVRPGNAVILERGPQQTRVSGPAVLTTNSFEYIKRIYGLQERQKSLSFENVLTSELTATTVAVTVTYCIDISDTARRGEKSLTGEEIERIKKMDTRIPDLERTVEGAIEASVRQAIGSSTFKELLTSEDTLKLEEKIIKIINRRFKDLGLRVNQVIVESVQPEGETATLTRAAAWREAIMLLADGYRNARKMGMPEEAIHREVLRRTLEQIAKDPATKLVFTPELDNALTSLRLSTGVDH